MNQFAGKSLEELIRPEGFDCPCGRHHSAPIRYLKIGPASIRMVVEAIDVLRARHPMVICGPFGYEVAGKRVISLLEENGIPYSLCVLQSENDKKIKPSEYAAGSMMLHFDHDCDLVLGIGSGVINDLCKVMGTTAKVPCMIVATAPSMDGYASDCSSLEIGGVKHSLKEQLPSAIICDTDLMAEAPMHMIHAGLGDILAKYTSLCDWKVSEIVTGEYYCDEVARLVRDSLSKTVRSAGGIRKRDPGAVQIITEGLVLSGIGIAYAGNSHPASGLEHYFSHCWEMMMMERGREYELHGIQVGIGMLQTLKIIEKMRTIHPQISRVEAAADAFDQAAWEHNLRRVFPLAASNIITIEKQARKNERAGRLQRASRAIEHWNEILEQLEALPASSEIEELMTGLGMPVKPRQIGLTPDDVADAFVCSRDIRDKYLLSSLLWDLGYMEEFASWLRETE